jgi:hypothetical protein
MSFLDFDPIEGVGLQGDRRMIVEFRLESLDLLVFLRFIDSESVGENGVAASVQNGTDRFDGK